MQAVLNVNNLLPAGSTTEMTEPSNPQHTTISASLANLMTMQGSNRGSDRKSEDSSTVINQENFVYSTS